MLEKKTVHIVPLKCWCECLQWSPTHENLGLFRSDLIHIEPVLPDNADETVKLLKNALEVRRMKTRTFCTNVCTCVLIRRSCFTCWSVICDGLRFVYSLVPYFSFVVFVLNFIYGLSFGLTFVCIMILDVVVSGIDVVGYDSVID